MKNISKFLIPAVAFALLLVAFAAADAKVTYEFYDQSGNPINDVDVVTYVCKDANCSSVQEGNQTNSNEKAPLNDVIITYPTKLLTPNGYAIYFFAEGYVPKEMHSFTRGTGSATQKKTLNKVANCHSAISEFSVVNKAEPNIPLIINVVAQADANTYSAFNPAGTPPFYKPQDFIDKGYYSALTEVDLKVTNSAGTQVYSQKKTVNLYMGDSQAVQFEWTPADEGSYNVVATTTVVDSQCSSGYSENAQKALEVLSSRPVSMCYTLLNDLSVSDKYPVVGTPITLSVDKISNYADSQQTLNPVATAVDLEIRDANGNVAYGKTINVGANQNTVNAVKLSESWTPLAAGVYTVSFSAKGADSRCDATQNKEEKITQTITVRTKESTQPDIYFTVMDAENTAYKIPGVTIKLTNKLTNTGKSEVTNANGNALFVNLDKGTYAYTLENKYYNGVSGSVILGTVDSYISRSLIPKAFTLKVNVVDVNRNVIPGAAVDLSGLNGLVFQQSKTTDANGVVLFQAVHAGNFDVYVSKASQAVRTTVDLDANKDITVVLNGVSGDKILSISSIACINPIEKGKMQTCTVNVKDSNGNLISDASVSLYDSVSNALIGSAATDANGNAAVQFPVAVIGDFSVYAIADKTGYVSDNDKNPAAAYKVTVPGANPTLPYFSPALTDKTVVIGQTLSFAVKAVDNDGDIIYYAVENLPSGAEFKSSGASSAAGYMFSWTPVYSQIGSYKVKFKVSDNSIFPAERTVIAEITINVLDLDSVSNKEALGVQKLDVSYEDVVAGGQFITSFTLGNDELVDLKHVKVTVSIPELGVWSAVGPFELSSGDEVSKTVIVDIPKNAKPGKYYVRYDIKDAKAKAQLTRDFIRVVKK